MTGAVLMPVTGTNLTQADPTLLPIPDWVFWALVVTLVVTLVVIAIKGFIDGIRQYRR